LPITGKCCFSDAAKYTTLSRAFTGRLGRGITSRIAKEADWKGNRVFTFPAANNVYVAVEKKPRLSSKSGI